jgi:hypothetical protein
LADEELIKWVRKRIAELEEELSKMREILSVLENRQVTARRGGESFTEEDLAALPWREYQSGRGRVGLRGSGSQGVGRGAREGGAGRAGRLRLQPQGG